MDKLRLLLRSVYLKGHQDGNMKTSDMSWEDKIIESLKQVFLGMLPEEITIKKLKSKPCPYSDKIKCCTMQDYCFNSAIQEYKRRVGCRIKISYSQS